MPSCLWSLVELLFSLLSFIYNCTCPILLLGLPGCIYRCAYCIVSVVDASAGTLTPLWSYPHHPSMRKIFSRGEGLLTWLRRFSIATITAHSSRQPQRPVIPKSSHTLRVFKDLVALFPIVQFKMFSSGCFTFTEIQITEEVLLQMIFWFSAILWLTCCSFSQWLYLQTPTTTSRI